VSVAASVIVMRESNYGNHGMTIHAQVLVDYAYTPFSEALGLDVSGFTHAELGNMRTTMDLTRATNGEELFLQICAVVCPALLKANQPDYSALPMGFRGPMAANGFRSVDGRLDFVVRSGARTWPWLGMVARQNLEIWSPR
jgi:hypothetical protein